MPVKDNWANGQTVTASDLNELGGAVNALEAAGGVSSWNDLEDKPAVIAAGADQAAARTAIGAVATADITAAVNAVLDGAPGALDTLNELAAALGDDANYAATVTASLAALDNPIVLTPTGVAATDGPAMDAAVTTAKASGRAIVLKAGTFRRTTAWDLRNSMSLHIEGAGSSDLSPMGTVIECTTDTADLLLIGGFGNYLGGFQIRHANFTPSGTTGNGIVFHKSAYSKFDRIEVFNAKNLMYIAQTDVFEPGSGSGTGNYMFSNVFENISLHNYSNSGIHLHGYNAASTGSVWKNIYVQNGSGGSPRTSTSFPVDLQGMDESVFFQLNIEDHAGTAIGILANFSNVTINSLHFERVAMTDWQPSYVRAYGGSSITINGMTVAFSDVQATGSGNYSSLFSAAVGGVIDAKGIYVKDCTKTLALPWRWVMAEDTDAANSVTIDTPLVKAGSPAFAAATTSTAANGIKRLGSTIYSPALVTPALGTPASGTLTNCTGLPESGVTNLVTDLAAKAPLDATINAQTGTTYTLVAGDDGKVVTLNNASAITVTVPQNSAAAIPVGSYIEFIQLGAGQVTFAAGTGATLNSRGGALKINAQYGVAALRKVATNTFILAGDTTT